MSRNALFVLDVLLPGKVHCWVCYYNLIAMALLKMHVIEFCLAPVSANAGCPNTFGWLAFVPFLLIQFASACLPISPNFIL